MRVGGNRTPPPLIVTGFSPAKNQKSQLDRWRQLPDAARAFAMTGVPCRAVDVAGRSPRKGRRVLRQEGRLGGVK